MKILEHVMVKDIDRMKGMTKSERKPTHSDVELERIVNNQTL